MNRATQGEPRLEDFQYVLPDRCIALSPAPKRASARMLMIDRHGARPPRDRTIRDLPDLVTGDELFVLNDTRVVPARLRGHKPTGGRVELLVLAPCEGDPGQVTAMGQAAKALRPGTPVVLPGGETLHIRKALGHGHYQVELPPGVDDVWAFLADHGEVPLPPYIHRESGPTPDDHRRYQTVYATHPGSVAAPTAGLHMTEALLDGLEARGCAVARLTLHVGPGTFLPVRETDLADHTMHAERYHVPEACAAAVEEARRLGRPIVAVGTTVVRTLEAAAKASGNVQPGAATTDIFLRPGHTFRVVDQLLTNFHLPQSTLLMLVCALAGRRTILDAYGLAMDRGYRFYSYGDAMWIR